MKGDGNSGEHAIYRIKSFRCETTFRRNERESNAVVPQFDTDGTQQIAKAVQTLTECDKSSAYHSGSSTSEIRKQLVRPKVGHGPASCESKRYQQAHRFKS